jgi:DNA-binding LacI/PurR family transcriptional regulator
MARGLMVIAFGLHPGADGIEPAASISVDNHHGAVLATRHLLDLGHRRIAFLSDLPRVTSRLERIRGYREAMAAAGLPAETALVRARGSAGGSDAGGADGGRTAARRLLSHRPRPTAVVAGNDLCALGTLAAAHELGLSVPADLSVIGFDDIALARVVTPPLTTVRQPARTIARMAVQQLLAAPHRTGGVALVVRPRLILRSSTARPARTQARRSSNGENARGGLTHVPRVVTELVGSEISATRR